MVVGTARDTRTSAELRRPLLVTADSELLDELVRIADRVGIRLNVATDALGALRWYEFAPLVLIGIDAAEDWRRSGLPGRSGLVLVGRYAANQVLPWDVAGLVGAEHLAALPSAEGWLTDRFTQVAERVAGSAWPPDGKGWVVAVLGGRGGAGASVLAAAFAVTAARDGLRTLLIDADPLGGGVDLVLGWETVDGLRWPGLSETSGRVNPPALVEVLPRVGDLAVLSWDRDEAFDTPAEAMATTLDAGRRGRDLVVVDLPRHLDDAAVIALSAADRAFLLVPMELRACAAAAKVAAVAGQHCLSLSLVVRGPSPGGLKVTEVVNSVGLPLAGQVRAEPGLAKALENGMPPAGDGKGPLATLCRRLLDELRAESR